MDNQPNGSSIVTRPQPQLIQSILWGFETVANHLPLMIPAVALDLWLWFGPHLRLRSLFEPVLRSSIDFVRTTATTDMGTMWETLEVVWLQFLERFNLTSLLSTLPIGVPSLMAGEAPLHTPVGDPAYIEVQSIWQILLLWLAFTAVGLVLGTLYYAAVARATGKQGLLTECEDFRSAAFRAEQPSWLRSFAWQCGQMVILMFILFIATVAILLPTILIASFLALVSPFLGQSLLLLVSFSAVWFLIPLIFTPHGIFVCQAGILRAMALSVVVVRLSLAKTGLFLVCLIVLNQGLSIIWSMPNDGSWMMAVGIVGHAFISAALLAASFNFFRGGLAYAQSFRKAPLPSA